MTELSKIDELIRQRALNEAEVESKAAIAALPYWSEDITVYADEFKGEVTIKRWRLLPALQAAIEAEIYKSKVEHYSRKVLDAIDELDWLRESVNNLERGS